MAEKVWDCCPKCSSKLTNKVECTSCGLIFDKYFQAEARRKAQAEKDAEKKERFRKHVLVALSGLILAGIAAAAFLFWVRTDVPPVTKQDASLTDNSRDGVEQEAERPDVQKPKDIGVIGKGGDGDKQFIQNAINATVTVETPWGAVGSGFFINENSLVTNRHVAEFNIKDFEVFRKKVAKGREEANLEADAIKELKQKLDGMPDGPNRTQVFNLIHEKEAGLNNYLSKLQKAEKELADMDEKRSSQDIKIILADGSEHSVSTILLSDAHDLALLKVYGVNTAILRPNKNGRHLEQGDTVFTIGSPSGLRNTVTSGIFSGYRKAAGNDDIYLQIDAPINPGNSGGPLIDGHGNVYGVNTMILTNTEGLGFAIPIEAVFDDFRISL